MTWLILSCVKVRRLRKPSKLLLKILSNCYTSRCVTEELIRDNTEGTRDHMTPEILLHLITRSCKLWHENGDNSPFADPFWAFYWPGGQVLTRYILDNPDVFRGETVLDVGTGCGASAIAAKLVGASRVVANDTDQVALQAVKMNAAVNGVHLELDSGNLIGQLCPDWSTILLGDMFYDEMFRDSLVSWLTKHYNSHETNIFIGDPGRLPLIHHPIKKHLLKVAEYELPRTCQLENNGLSTGYVWKLEKG